ncbi:glycoside hydrolase family 13 protein [Microaerobacter geothermalis]|uniref:glycoside hydrolase family 13 protein n=1 Tax=Microaerobacter geothermalis TaxID=674972 RepID=UPI001F3D5608|nr:glycoside hydrolase family 13 protein [Microaerobacter geothermalis]MCF6094269.1 glycoside hydrolase family 13 protein [Microaerobacter geothermalis]
MHLEAIYHDAFGSYAFPLDRQRLKVRLRAKKGDLQKVEVVHGDRYTSYETGKEQIVVLEKVGSTDLHDYFEAVLKTETGRLRYVFYLSDGEKGIWYGERGFAESFFTCQPFQYAYITEQDLFEIPEWVDGSIVYQIFPERFANGNPDNDPEGVLPWGGEPKWNNFFGGDIQGIIQNLDYLADLGINVIYLTPIFESPSNHKYNTTDYYRIDPHFGDLEDVKEMVAKAHKLGIRVIFDAVFNHCGYDFFAFQDVVEKGKKSPYWDWFFVEDEPVITEPRPNYETFACNVWEMPKLNTKNPKVKKYLLDVARYWIEEADIDGWRLDVSNEVDHVFWREFRQVVKGAKADALIIGEVWHNANPWLQGDQYDSVMNYLFRDAMLEFFAKQSIGVEKFNALLIQAQMCYKDQANRGMFNLIDSHDTERFLTTCDEKEERMRLAVLFQMAYPGMPMIYYGDEIGMKGKNDPDCRRTFIWKEEEQNQEMLNWYKKCIQIRKSLPALTKGNYRTWVIRPTGNIFGIMRGTDTDQPVGVLINNSSLQQELTVPVLWKQSDRLQDLISGETYPLKNQEIRLVLKPYQGVLLV